MTHQNGADHDNDFHLRVLSVNMSACTYIRVRNKFKLLRKTLKKMLEKNICCTDVALESSKGQVSFISEQFRLLLEGGNLVHVSQ